MFKLITLNAFGVPQSLTRGIRLFLLGKELEKLSPDIVFLQEIIFGGDRKFLERRLLRSGYHFIPERHRIFQNGGLAVISKMPVADWEFIKFQDQGRWFSRQITDRILGKGFIISRLIIGNKALTMVNVHFLSHYFSFRTLKNDFPLQNQVRELIAKLKERTSDFDPLIIAGDFNFPKNSSLFAEIKNQLGLRDTVQESGLITFDVQNLNNRAKNWFRDQHGDARIDFILHRHLPFSHIKAKLIFQEIIKYHGLSFNLSDHYGLEMTAE